MALPNRYRTFLPVTILMLLCTSGCSKAYFSAMEKFGYHKRDLLVSRVEKAARAQEETKDQFTSALDRFSSVIRFDGGALQEKYETLQAEYDGSLEKADKLRSRIDDVEDVAEALFDEWEDELDEYQSARLRRSSEKRLRETRRRYEPMIQAMRRVERKMEPVLEAFQDQVLYLKHNLNAQAIASLKQEFRGVESDIESLVRDMEASIREANAFVTALGKG